MDRELRLLVVDDHSLMRQVLRAALDNHPWLRVVGEAGTGHDALAQARRLNPDVVVLDLGLPDIGGVEVTRLLRTECPATAVAILTSSDSDAELMAALQAGARGFILKTSNYDELIASLEGIAAGHASLPPEVLGRVLKMLPDQPVPAPQSDPDGDPSGAPLVDLSEREIDVVRLLVKGIRNREIAEVLGLSETTVRSYLTHIMQKLKVENRVQVATEAVRRGLVSLD